MEKALQSSHAQQSSVRSSIYYFLLDLCTTIVPFARIDPNNRTCPICITEVSENPIDPGEIPVKLKCGQ